MADRHPVRLGPAQQTPFMPLAARAKETGKRRPVLRDPKAAQMLESIDWLDAVTGSPGPYFFVADGVLVYLPERSMSEALARIARRFPGARIAFDTYSKQMLDRQHQLAAKRDMARWAWACDDPRSLERNGLRLAETATLSRPPRPLRARLPARYRYLLPLADPLLRQAVHVTVFQADSGHAHTES